MQIERRWRSGWRDRTLGEPKGWRDNAWRENLVADISQRAR